MARKTLEELESMKAGEQSEESRVTYPAGVYEFDKGEGAEEESGGRYSRIIARSDSRFGTPQADALVRVGYKFVRPATAEDINEVELGSVLAAQKPAGETVSKSDFDALKSQFDELSAALGGKEKTEENNKNTAK